MSPLLSPRRLLALALTALAGNAARADDYAEAAAAFQAANTAYRAQDSAGFLAAMERTVSLRSDHPRFLYFLAAARALNGQTDAATAALHAIAELGLTVPAETESDFDSIRDTPNFKSAVAALSANRAPHGNAPVAFTFPAHGGIWEGIAHDPREGITYVSNLRRGIIVRHSADGSAQPFVSSSETGFGFGGLAIDPARDLLWVSSPALPEVDGYTDALAGQSHVLALDLHDGSFRQSISLPRDPSQPHTVVDLTVAPNGIVYATDSATPTIWRIKPGATRAEPWVQITAPGNRHSLQGIVTVANGNWVIVADYSTGLLAVNAASAETHILSAPAPWTLLGIDGLAAHSNLLLAVQNGVTPIRLIALSLSLDPGHPDHLPSLHSAQIVARALPAMSDPTLATLANGAFLVIGAAGWSHFGANAKPDPPDRTVPILRIPFSL